MISTIPWKTVTLGPFIDIINGGAFPSDRFVEDEGMPLIRIRDLEHQDTEINFSGQYNNHYIVKHGDLLIGMDGNFLTVKWKGNNALLNQRVCKLVTKDAEQLDQDFLFYRIINEIIQINHITSATTVKHLSSRDILGITIDLPTKPEQAKIAEVLSTVDRAIEQTEALIAKQQRIKTGLMQDLLTRGIDEDGHLRSEETHEFKDSHLGLIPVEWSIETLEKCVEFWDGKRVPLKQADRDKMYGEYPYYGASGIIDYIDRFLFDGDLILLGEDGENIVSRNLPLAFQVRGKIWVNNHAHVLKPKNGYDIYFLTNRLEFYDYALLISGSAQPKLNQRNLRLMNLPMPPVLEQKRIGEIFLFQERERDIHKLILHKLCSLKTGLMQDLLTGKVRVTPLLNELQEAVA